MSGNKEIGASELGGETREAFPTVSVGEPGHQHDPSRLEQIGTQISAQIGPYELLAILGEGGFGVIFRAEQKEPVKRQVALKVIKPGMDSKQVIRRFEAERQALALLDHPNIARVFDAGTTENGRPYFVMEYVRGIRITEYCDRNKLDIEERLQLFLQICEAIQYAHQKGIIHRDIKPSNILVSQEQGKEELKVIDFGVAKALHQQLTERTLLTEQGQLIGTPEYMSPEQAELTKLDIDTRSDIYSLGVLLYELLTGALPFDPQKLREAPFDEIIRMIRDQVPPRPSARLLGLGEKAAPIAASRRTDARTLARRLSRELEWIPLMAMRKERDHRYETAFELANDVKRYLNNDPLVAGPESAAYRARKFARRHTGLLVSAASIIVLLVLALLGFAVSMSMYSKAESARVDAEKSRERANEQKEQLQQVLADLYEARGQGQISSRQVNKAIALFNEAYQLDPHRESLRLLLSEALRGLGQSVFLENKGPLWWEQVLPNPAAASWSVQAIFNETEDRLLVYLHGQYGLWNAETGRFIKGFNGRFVGFTHNGLFLAFWQGGRMLLYASKDGNLVLDRPAAFGCLTSDFEFMVLFTEDGQFRVLDNSQELFPVVLDAKLVVPQEKVMRLAAANAGEDIMETPLPALENPSDGECFSLPDFHIQVSDDRTKLLLVGGRDLGTCIWDLSSGSMCCTVKPHIGEVTKAVLSPDGHKMLLLTTEPGDKATLALWSVDANSVDVELSRAAPGQYDESSFGFAPDGRTLVVLDNSRLEVWDANTRSSLWEKSAVAYAYVDANSIIIGDSSGSVSIHDTRTGNILNEWKEESGPILDVAVLCEDRAKSRRLIVDAWFNRYIYDLNGTKKTVMTASALNRHFGLSPHANFVFVPDDSGKFRIVSNNTVNAYAGVFGGSDASKEYKLLGISPDRKLVAFEDQEGDLLVIFDTSEGQLKKVWRFPGESQLKVIFVPGHPQVLVRSVKEGMPSVRLLDMEATDVSDKIDQMNLSFVCHDGGTFALAKQVRTPRTAVQILRAIWRIMDYDWTVTSRDALIDWSAGEIHLGDTESGKFTATVTADDSPFISLAFSPHGDLAVTVTESGKVELWDAQTGDLKKMLLSDPRATACVFSSDGSRLLLKILSDNSAAPSEIQLWNARLWQLVKAFPQTVYAAFSPDGQKMLTVPPYVSDESDYAPLAPVKSSLCNAKDGQNIATFDDEFRFWVFSPDSKYLVTTDPFFHHKVWDANDGSLVCTLASRQAMSMITDISHDGNFVITVRIARYPPIAENRIIEVFDLRTGRLMTRFEDSLNTPPVLSDKDFLRLGETFYDERALEDSFFAVFNNNNTRLVIPQALLNISREQRPPRDVDRWVKAHIPLRVQSGNLRVATSEEMSKAERDYEAYTAQQEESPTLALASQP